jgi:hypothetical protein
MADDTQITDENIIPNEKETRFFFYAKAAMATKVKS